MGHGFDTTGRKLDENGKEHDWWTSEDSAEYDKKAQFLIDQYNNYDDSDFEKKFDPASIGSSPLQSNSSDDSVRLKASFKIHNFLQIQSSKFLEMSEKDTTTKSHHPMKTITIVLIWIFALYAALLIVKNHETPQKPLATPSRPVLEPVKHKGVCKSPECITLAQNLHNWRDVSVDPCQDFYKAACGKYTEQTLSPGSRMVKKTYILKQLIHEFLLKDEQSTSKSENAMKIYYKRCAEDEAMNETRKNEIKKDYLLQMVKEVGSFPMLTKNWTEADFDLNDILVRMGKFSGFKPGILKLGVLVKPFRFSDFLFPWINKLGIGSTKKQQVEDVKAVLEMSRQLQEFNNNSTEIRSLSDFEAHMPSLSLEKIFNTYFDPRNTEKIWEKIKPMIQIPNHPLFFNGTKNLETIIQSTPKRTLANYLFISFIDNLSNHWEGEESKKRDCTMKVMNDLPLASIRVFTRNHFDKENLAVASEMVEEIQESFAETIRGSTWLSEHTKMAALRKLDMMKKIVGYPKEFEVPGALDSYLDTLSLADKSSFYAAKIEIERFHGELLMSYIASVLTVLPLFQYVASNAMYIQHDNSITLNVAILSDPFLDSTYPKYAKIASIGAVVGHEMGHGYDPEGRRFDENGDQNDRWTSEDAVEYDRRTQCLIDQYNNYDDPDFGRNLNGSVTIKEIASDIIGTDVSWKSYNKVDFANEPSIFGFEDEKPDKLFFHLTALNWCSPRSTVTLAEQLEQVHPTESFRVNGVFRNMKTFADAFNCPVGSPMNPKNKCELF
ncbi:hypothetical protein B9Z55_020982 [Caenorhabditis nigoni]|uniref:Peptidase M13 C-terminal domain-containing protein n=1 Tax=Caenorhabditis nigoni TaxID=1611254 RepID=A0A2G5TQ42_9PELO|nr:hypothetical protein B9Z55_020982 [Caenorhabditis nigoni]